jgi:hypothetical protein
LDLCCCWQMDESFKHWFLDLCCWQWVKALKPSFSTKMCFWNNRVLDFEIYITILTKKIAPTTISYSPLEFEAIWSTKWSVYLIVPKTC